MRLLTPGRLIAPALFLATGMLVIGASDASGQPGKKDKDVKEKLKDKEKAKGPGGKAVRDLRKVYEKFNDVSGVKIPGKEAALALNQAERFYREAVRTYRDGATERSAELAAAAHDAVRGLEHLRRATFTPVADLPEPPDDATDPVPPGDPKGPKGPPPVERERNVNRGVWSEPLEVLTVTRERLASVDEDFASAGEILDAARAVYAQARTAYELGNYRKSAELARAAEAWSHIGEHLQRSGWAELSPTPAAPSPRPKTGPGVPPPPPPLKN